VNESTRKVVEKIATAAIVAAVATLSGYSIWKLRPARTTYDAVTHSYYFYGYKCKDHCQGHEAGFKWAVENTPEQYEECPSRSKSFYEGCAAYVERMEYF
jgi:hypothetical protein